MTLLWKPPCFIQLYHLLCRAHLSYSMSASKGSVINSNWSNAALSLLHRFCWTLYFQNCSNNVSKFVRTMSLNSSCSSVGISGGERPMPQCPAIWIFLKESLRQRHSASITQYRLCRFARSFLYCQLLVQSKPLRILDRLQLPGVCCEYNTTR